MSFDLKLYRTTCYYVFHDIEALRDALFLDEFYITFFLCLINQAFLFWNLLFIDLMQKPTCCIFYFSKATGRADFDEGASSFR